MSAGQERIPEWRMFGGTGNGKVQHLVDRWDEFGTQRIGPLCRNKTVRVSCSPAPYLPKCKRCLAIEATFPSEERRKGERRVKVAETCGKLIRNHGAKPWESRWIKDRRTSERRKGAER